MKRYSHRKIIHIIFSIIISLFLLTTNLTLAQPVTFNSVHNQKSNEERIPSKNTFFQPNDLIEEKIQQLDSDMILNYLQTIVSFGPRRTGTQACIDTGEWIYTEFQNMGLQVRYHNWSHGGETGKNIEATILGENTSSPYIYVICAHYDTVSGSPGADDNGGGVAAVLAAAELLSQCKVNHTIRFLAFSGEEQGLYGSYQYAKQASLNADNIIAALNADMIGYAITAYQGNHISIYYNTQSTWIVDYIDTTADTYFNSINLEVYYGGYSWGSDHSSFWQWGYDAVQYKEYEVNPNYHTPNDIIANMNVTYATKCAKLFFATIAEFIQISSSETNQPPTNPTITGPVNGKAGIEYPYSFKATDPNTDQLYYYIDWGDNQYAEWIGPYQSNEEITITHIWQEKGDYTIKAKVKDTYGEESEWTQLPISMPFSQQKNNHQNQILQRIPTIFTIRTQLNKLHFPLQ
jgi:aminopeptidase YwaD